VRVALLALVGLVAGCFTKPEQFGGGGADAGRDGATGDASGDGGVEDGSGAPCSFDLFTTPLFTGSITGEPTIRDDGGEFFFAYQLRGNAWEIRSGVRAAPGQFVDGPGLPAVTDETIDQDPSISSDGNVMVYRSLQASTNPYVAQVVRTGQTWSAPIPVLTGFPVASVDLSGDGKTLYFTVNGDSLRKAVRSNVSSSFTVEGTDLGGPYRLATVGLPDGREVFHSPEAGANPALLHATRLSDTGPFGPSDVLAGGLFDPDLSGDGLQLIAANPSGGIAISTRTCLP
jgi:hypothetical protein